jgi:hypothetical protein
MRNSSLTPSQTLPYITIILALELFVLSAGKLKMAQLSPLLGSKCHHHYNKIIPQNPIFDQHAAQHLHVQNGTLLFPVEYYLHKGIGTAAPVQAM